MALQKIAFAINKTNYNQIKIKLFVNNIISKIIKKISLNNINTIFYKYASFIWYLINTLFDIVIVNNSLLNFSNNCLVSIKIKLNAIVNSDSKNFNSNKNTYFFNNYSFLLNYTYYKNNLDGNNNSKFDKNSIVSIKKCIREK